MTITWSSNPGQIYLIESSIDLAVWLEVDDPVPSGGVFTNFTNFTCVPGAGCRPSGQGFLRVREL